MLAAASVVLAAIAGSLFSSGPASAALLAALVTVVAAAMFCGAAVAVNAFRTRVRSEATLDSDDPTVELAVTGLVERRRSPSLPSLKPLGAFVAASSATIALIAATLSWTRDSNAVIEPAAPPSVAAAAAEPVPLARPVVEQPA